MCVPSTSDETNYKCMKRNFCERKKWIAILNQNVVSLRTVDQDFENILIINYIDYYNQQHKPTKTKANPYDYDFWIWINATMII